MNTSHWEIARVVKTMGMKTTIVLEPEHITVRIKNNVKKMLRSGRITGGWSSQSAKLAEHVADKFELPVTRDTWQGVKITKADMDTKRMLLDILHADWAAAAIGDYQHYITMPYYRERHKQAQIDLQSRTSKNFCLQFFDKEFADQARALMSQTLTPAARELIEKALDRLDSNEPIHITTYQ